MVGEELIAILEDQPPLITDETPLIDLARKGEEQLKDEKPSPEAEEPVKPPKKAPPAIEPA